MLAIILLVFIFYATQGQICTYKAQPLSADYLPVSLYSSGANGTSSYNHLIQTSSPGGEFNWEYDLDTMTIKEPFLECPSACMTEWKPMYNKDTETYAMARTQDQPYFTGFSLAPYSSMYCATNSGDCGAKIPIYLYYNETIQDYYISTSGGGPSENATPYPLSAFPMGLTPGTPLCYLWESTLTTTTTTTTTATSTTTTTPSLNVTKTNVPSNVSTTTLTTLIPVMNATITTLLPINSSLTTILPGFPSNNDTNGTTSTTLPNNNMTTTTVYRNTTTVPSNQTTVTTIFPPTTVIGGGPGNSTEDNSTDTTNTTTLAPSQTTTAKSLTDKAKKKLDQWKWPLIVFGCLLTLGGIIGLITCCTIAFIGPAKKRTTPPPPYTYEMTAQRNNLTPPQPVSVTESPQPLTVNYPSSGPYNMPGYYAN